MAFHNDFGKEAEKEAAAFLEAKGYRIIKKNFRFQKAEIDLIAEFEDKIIIIEVKARTGNHFIEPYQAVDKRKIRQILSATQFYLEETDEDREVRFDIISIIEKGLYWDINHIEDAFQAFDAN